MLNGYRIIDSDAHVVEPVSMWYDYLEPQFHYFAPSADMRINGEEIVDKVSGNIRELGNQQMEFAHPNAYYNHYNVESQVQEMMMMGVDVAFLYPTYGLWIWAIDSMHPEVAGAYTRAYNNWLRDFCNYAPDRLRGVGAINLHLPERMVSELHEIVNFGWRSVFLRPNPVKGRLLSDPAYEPFWTECERLGVSVGIHEGTHSRLPTTGQDRFNSRFATHACSHPMEQMMAFLALLEGGVLERHPQLKFGFLESGCGWLPYWLWRLDQEYRNLRYGDEIVRNVRTWPSEYFRRQCFISVEPSEPYLSEVIQYIGIDNLIFGSDYPHMDHNPKVVKEFLELEDKLSKYVLQKILWDNPCSFYGLY